MLGDAGDEDAPCRGPLQQLGHEHGRDAPVGHQVAVDQDEGAGLGLLDAALDGVPLPPVTEQVGVDARVAVEPQAQPIEGGPLLARAEQVGAQLAFVVEHPLAGHEPNARRPRDEQLHAPGVGHHALPAVDGPHVGRRRRPLERPKDDLGLEQQVAPGRVGERGHAAGQQLGQTDGGLLQGWFHASSFPSGCDSYKRVIYPQAGDACG